MSIELLAIPAIALVAVVLLVLSGRAGRTDAGGSGSELRAEAVVDEGVRAGTELATWSSIFEVAVVTRRTLRGTWFGLEVMADGVGCILIDGADDLVEPFLAESYRLPGFDHAVLSAALSNSRSRAVCYRA